MASQTILAQKGNKTRRFTEYNWKLLGDNKQGWVKISDQTATNTATGSLQKPPIGSVEMQAKNQVNLLGKHIDVIAAIDEASEKMEAKDFEGALVVANALATMYPSSKFVKSMLKGIEEAEKMSELGSSNSNKKPEDKKVEQPLEANKEAFLELLKDYNKTAIKDYFDAVDHKYNAKANLDELKVELAEYFNYDEAKFNEALG